MLTKFIFEVVDHVTGEKIEVTIDDELQSMYESCQRMKFKQIKVDVFLVTSDQNQPHNSTRRNYTSFPFP